MRYLLFALVVFASNIIQAITGFAGTLLAMPAGIRLMGMDAAKAVLNVMGIAASVMIVATSWRDIDRKALLRISCFMGIGILLGLGLLRIARVDFLLTLYGLFIIGYALVKLLLRQSRPLTSRAGGMAILVLAGVIHGLFISGGSLLVIYAVSALPEKRTFRATLSGVWIILNSLMMFQHISAGFFTRDVTVLTLVCLMPLAAAVVLGAKLHDRVRQSTFLRLTYALLLVSGCLILF